MQMETIPHAAERGRVCAGLREATGVQCGFALGQSFHLTLDINIIKMDINIINTDSDWK